MYEIETYTICNGWTNCWSENDGLDEPLKFKTKKEARTALNEFFADMKDAVKKGFLDDFEPRNYRIIKVVT